jgi:hypothetical protein
MQPKASPMSPSAVRPAAKRGKRSAMLTAATVGRGAGVGCSPQCVLSVVKNVRYHLSVEKANEYLSTANTLTGDMAHERISACPAFRSASCLLEKES